MKTEKDYLIEAMKHIDITANTLGEISSSRNGDRIKAMSWDLARLSEVCELLISKEDEK